MPQELFFSIPGIGIGVEQFLAATAPQESPRFAIPVFDRSVFPKQIVDQISAARRKRIEGETDPNVRRFTIPLAQAYFSRIVERLLSGSALKGMEPPIRFFLNDSSWGLPGADISAGVGEADAELIEALESEDEIAAVLAHEIAHHVRAHSEQVALLQLKHPAIQGRSIFDSPEASDEELDLRWRQELEADGLSVLMLSNAGYDASAAVDALYAVQRVFETDPRYEFYRGRTSAKHPLLEMRARHMRKVIAQNALAATPRIVAGLEEVQQELACRKRPGNEERSFLHRSRRFSCP